MKEWFTVQELVGLPGMPGTDRGVRRRVSRRATTYRKRTKGKGFEYHISGLPIETQGALVEGGPTTSGFRAWIARYVLRLGLAIHPQVSGHE